MQEVRVSKQVEEEMLAKARANGCRTKLDAVIERFVCSEDRVIEIVPDPGEYVNLSSAQGSLNSACKRSGYRIYTKQIKGHLYLIKEDAIDE